MSIVAFSKLYKSSISFLHPLGIICWVLICSVDVSPHLLFSSFTWHHFNIRVRYINILLKSSSSQIGSVPSMIGQSNFTNVNYDESEGFPASFLHYFGLSNLTNSCHQLKGWNKNKPTQNQKVICNYSALSCWCVLL